MQTLVKSLSYLDLYEVLLGIICSVMTLFYFQATPTIKLIQDLLTWCLCSSVKYGGKWPRFRRSHSGTSREMQTYSVISCTMSSKDTILKKGLAVYTDTKDNNINRN